MKTTRSALVLVLAAGLALLGAAKAAAAQQTAGELFEKALYVEEGQGDLQKAIGLYQDIVKKFPGEREVAAKAQLHIGLCYEKLGLTEAEKAYQKVVDNYPEQSEAVREAKEKLAAFLRARAVLKTGAAEFKLRQVWAGPGVDTMGRVSPDGRSLSFVDWETGDLAVRDLAAGTNRRLTNKGTWEQSPEFAMNSIWSRDGRRIAYLWYGKDDILELRVYDLKDSSIRTLHRNKTPQDWVQAMDWSPDGRHILTAYWTEATPTGDRASRLGLVSAEDNSVKELRCHFTTLLASDIVSSFAFSPDGRFIAYDAWPSAEEAEKSDIFLISVEDGTEKRLVEHPAHDLVVGWAPDGRGLLFTSDRTGSQDLWLLPMSDGMPQGGPRLVKTAIGTIITLGITSRGDLYYGFGGGSATDVYAVDVGPQEGGGRTQAKKLALPFQGENQFPDYSPDGKRIAYLSAPLGRPRIIGVYAQDTGRVRELNLGLPGLLFPRWIPPDGRTFSVAATDKEGRRWIYKVDVQTGTTSPIVQMDRGLMFRDGPVWAKDGKRFFFTAGIRSEDKRYVYACDPETGKQERLPGSPDNACFIALSPDGNWLALVNEQGKKSLRIMPASGGDPREIHSYEHADTVISLAWSADGRSIFVPKRRDPQKNIWDLFRVPVDGGDVEKIDLGLLWVRYLTASPDGRHIAFSSAGTGSPSSEVWAMENFLQAVPPPAAQDDTETRSRKVWDDAVDSYFWGAPSPDGKLMTYIDWNNFANLGVRDLATGEGRLLTDNKSWESGEMGYFSVFSPDGRRIAFAWQTKAGSVELRIIGTDGTGARVLNDGKQAASQTVSAWSRDGTHILGYRYLADRTLEIILVSVEDGTVKPVKTLAGLGAVSIKLCLSPDARYIACSRPSPQDMANLDIFIMAADGSREIPLVSHPAEDAVLGWAPDGKRLLFRSDRTGSTGVWSIEVAEGRPLGQPRLLKTDLGDFSSLGLTQDGRLFYGLYSGWSDIFVAALDPETGKVLTQPVKTILRNEGRNSAPDWSPDGETLACRTSGSSVEPGRAALFLHSLRTGETRELTLKKTGGLNYHFLRWSPDGRRLLCVGVDEKGSYGALHAVDARTGDSEIIARSDDRGFIFGCDWAPDGKSVYFFRRGKEERTLIRLDLATATEKALFRFPNSGYFRFVLSADGREVAFTTQNSLSVCSTTGGEPRDLVAAKDINAMTWTRDGKYILYGLLRKGTKNINDLWRVPAAGGQAEKLDLGMINLMHMRVHPDGRQIVFTAGDRPEKAEIWVLENFLTTGKK